MCQIKLQTRLIFVAAIFIMIFLSGCASFRTFSVGYDLNPLHVGLANKTYPLSVRVAKFQDVRPNEEKYKHDREKTDTLDLDDYTYDQDLSGPLAEQITKMTIDHLRFSNIFREVGLADFSTEQVNEKKVHDLAERGVNLLITGEIKHFYCYYDRRPSSELGMLILGGLIGGVSSGALVIATQPSYTVGTLIVSTGTSIGAYFGEYTIKLRVKVHTSLAIKLIHTETRDTLYAKSFESISEDTLRVFGVSSATKSNAWEIASNSLRHTVNTMVNALSKAAIEPTGIEIVFEKRNPELQYFEVKGHGIIAGELRKVTKKLVYIEREGNFMYKINRRYLISITDHQNNDITDEMLARKKFRRINWNRRWKIIEIK